MTMETYGDERDWEPGGIYYDGPSYTPEAYEEDYEDEYALGRDDADEHYALAPRSQSYRAPARLTSLRMPRITKPRRSIDDEF